MPSLRRALPDTYTFVLAAAIGLALGGLLSLVFGRFALPTRIPFQFTIGGFSTGILLTNIVLIAIVGAIVFFGYVSIVVQDTAFPRAHPWLFLVETLVVAFVPASVIYVMQDFRDDGDFNLSKLNQEFLLLGAKFGIFHLLFQFSGLYSYLFAPSSDSSSERKSSSTASK
jgi:hypothetical protein